MALLKFLKGNYASMSTASIVEGQVLICGDTGEMFVDVAADKRVKIGDYVTVASLDALMAIDATAVPTSRLYYVEGANILARSNGANWDQINKDTGATSIEVVGEGNAVTAASYDAVTRKLTLTKGETFATKAELDKAVEDLVDADDAILAKIGTVAEGKTVVGLIDAAQIAADNAQAAADAAQGEVDALEAYVGTIPADYTETNVIAYINKKAEETLNAASGGSSESAASVLAALNSYKAENDPKVAANTEAAAEAQAAAEAAQATADAAYVKPTDGIGTDDLHANVVASLAKADSALQAADIENKADKATTLEGYGIADAYTKTEVDGLVSAKVDQTAYDTKVDALEAEDSRLAGLISDSADAIDAEKTRAEGVEAGLDARLVEVETFFKTAEDETLDTALDTLVEIQKYITTEGSAADQMVLDIAANAAAIEQEAKDRAAADTTLQDNIDALSEVVDTKAAASDLEVLDGRVEVVEGKVSTLEGEMDAIEAKVDTGDQKVSEYVVAQISALNIGDYAKQADLESLQTKHNEYEETHASDYTNAQIDAAIDADVKVVSDSLDTHKADAVAHITADERTAWNGAVSDLATHKAAYDAKIAELVAEDADIRVDFAAADATLQSNIESVDAAYKAADEAINTEVAKKANSDDVYTKEQVEAMLTWGSF